MNNADYGLSLQKNICNKYQLEINSYANEQFISNYNAEYEKEFKVIVPIIFQKIGDFPTRLLTYSHELTKGKQTTSPHNFMLNSGQTLSIRTTKTSDKVAPKTVGQAGFPILNEYFGEIYGDEIENQADVRKMIFEHIHEALPVFIDNLFQSDYTVLISRKDPENIQIIKAEEVANFTFARTDFEFTRGLDTWTESTTLKYHGKSIAEIQTHKERSFKFRFIISSIPEWFRIIKENNETLGMSAEGAICDLFNLEKPESFKTRTSMIIEKQLFPVIEDAFKNMPKPIKHSGSTPGERGKQSKSSYDFVLEGGQTLSLKTNKGKMVCPPEVGQPGSKTCLLYFKKCLEKDIDEVNRETFKQMVFNKIEEMMPIYVEHMFDSDWLLWIYKVKDEYAHTEVNKNSIQEFKWEREKFSFTKPTMDEWNESNTVKYEGTSIGEFQIHSNRNCYKFRFQMYNLLNLLLNEISVDKVYLAM